MYILFKGAGSIISIDLLFNREIPFQLLNTLFASCFMFQILENRIGQRLFWII